MLKKIFEGLIFWCNAAITSIFKRRLMTSARNIFSYYISFHLQILNCTQCRILLTAHRHTMAWTTISRTRPNTKRMTKTMTTTPTTPTTFSTIRHTTTLTITTTTTSFRYIVKWLWRRCSITWRWPTPSWTRRRWRRSSFTTTPTTTTASSDTTTDVSARQTSFVESKESRRLSRKLNNIIKGF